MFGLRMVLAGLSICLLASCAGTTTSEYRHQVANDSRYLVEINGLNFEQPKRELDIRGVTMTLQDRYQSALGKPCLRYRSEIAAHHFCYDSEGWQEYTLTSVVLGSTP